MRQQCAVTYIFSAKSCRGPWETKSCRSSAREVWSSRMNNGIPRSHETVKRCAAILVGVGLGCVCTLQPFSRNSLSWVVREHRRCWLLVRNREAQLVDWGITAWHFLFWSIYQLSHGPWLPPIFIWEVAGTHFIPQFATFSIYTIETR